MADRFDLSRFVDAQDGGRAYERACEELRAGRKTSHWMWFVFPQIEGLGTSEMARRFAISSLEEARAYLADPVLGQRLLECAELVRSSAAASATVLLDAIDAIKLRSSMTLFARAAPDEPVFGEVLERYFAGEPDGETERRLGL